jgi:hypothetical protein
MHGRIHKHKMYKYLEYKHGTKRYRVQTRLYTPRIRHATSIHSHQTFSAPSSIHTIPWSTRAETRSPSRPTRAGSGECRSPRGGKCARAHCPPTSPSPCRALSRRPESEDDDVDKWERIETCDAQNKKHGNSETQSKKKRLEWMQVKAKD